MDFFVTDPEWHWWIILYFFCGGIAAGAYFTSTLIDLVGSERERELARVGYWIAFPLVLLCGLFLTVDLNKPDRFWHMLFKSEIVHEALAEGWPGSAHVGVIILGDKPTKGGTALSRLPRILRAEPSRLIPTSRATL